MVSSRQISCFAHERKQYGEISSKRSSHLISMDYFGPVSKQAVARVPTSTTFGQECVSSLETNSTTKLSPLQPSALSTPLPSPGRYEAHNKGIVLLQLLFEYQRQEVESSHEEEGFLLAELFKVFTAGGEDWKFGHPVYWHNLPLVAFCDQASMVWEMTTCEDSPPRFELCSCPGTRLSKMPKSPHLGSPSDSLRFDVGNIECVFCGQKEWTLERESDERALNDSRWINPPTGCQVHVVYFGIGTFRLRLIDYQNGYIVGKSKVYRFFEEVGGRVLKQAMDDCQSLHSGGNVLHLGLYSFGGYLQELSIGSRVSPLSPP